MYNFIDFCSFYLFSLGKSLLVWQFPLVSSRQKKKDIADGLGNVLFSWSVLSYLMFFRIFVKYCCMCSSSRVSMISMISFISLRICSTCPLV